MRFRLLLVPALLFALALSVNSQDEAKLSESDSSLLDQVAGMVVKPTSECVHFKAKAYSCWGWGGGAERMGWLERDADGKPNRVLDIDGEWMDVPAEFETFKFMESCEALLKDRDGDEEDDPFEGMDDTAAGAVGPVPELVLASWCRSLGDNKLAARLLKIADRGESDADTLKLLKSTLAWRNFAGAAHAFISGDDKQALHYAERFEEKYKEFDAEFGTPNSEILADLLRRRKAGTFGKYEPSGGGFPDEEDDGIPEGKLPEGYDKWKDDRKADWLIERLENVDARQWSQPGGVHLSGDWRVKALTKLGEAAVPKLIDCIESDRRLTRSMHFWRDFAQSRTVLGVREPALVAIMTILQVEAFEPVATGDDFSSRGEEGAKKVAAQLRKYWKEYGKYPFDERMMKILTNTQATLDARQEAALNLAYINDRPARGTTVWTSGSRKRSEGPNPVVEKFKDPTAAEAVVQLMDQHFAQIAEDESDDPDMLDYYLTNAAWTYSTALTTLDDKRITPTLRTRAEDEKLPATVRRIMAWACLWLDDDAPFNAFCKRFEDGTEPGLDDPEQLDDILYMLTRVESVRSQAALNAMLQETHPAFETFRDKVLHASPGWSDDAVWFRTTAAITLLRGQLDNTNDSGSYFKISNGVYTEGTAGSSASGDIPDYLKEDRNVRKSADGRFCDDAAMKLNELVGGLPRYNPLLSDSEERLKFMRELLDRYAASIRPATVDEAETLGEWGWDPFFVFAPPPLGRAATEDDVKAGRAIFALEGGRPGKLKLPAKGAFGPAPAANGDEPVEDDRGWCLIVQEEVDAGGKTWYGAMARYGTRKIEAYKIHDVQSLKRD
ncbi:MAG: hypothetical protein KDB82_03935 [Planctomycetes bacterium]|nr:hypothetical protein [Planctomycetota bacterium]